MGRVEVRAASGFPAMGRCPWGEDRAIDQDWSWDKGEKQLWVTAQFNPGSEMCVPFPGAAVPPCSWLTSTSSSVASFMSFSSS